MEYLDFEIRLFRGSEAGSYRVSVIESPGGRPSATWHLPKLDADIGRALGLRRGHGAPAAEAERGVRISAPEAVEPARTVGAREFGAALFNALLTSEVRSSYRLSRQRAADEGKGLRLRVRVDAEAPELASVPWELLYDEEGVGDFLALSKQTPVIRQVELLQPTRPLTVAPPLNILGLVASPTDMDALDVAREQERMEQALEHLIDAGIVHVHWLEGRTWRALQTAFRGGPWHIFHFIGHGGFDEGRQEGEIYLLAEGATTRHRLRATELGRLLNDHEELRVAVLNSCEGARSSETRLLSSTGAAVTRRGVPAVVSMQYEISDKAALEFSRTFYETLADGWPVEACVAEARSTVSYSVQEVAEWATPVLHMRGKEGQLFQLDQGRGLFPEHTPAAKAHRPEPPPPVPAKRVSRGEGRYDEQLSILAEKVDQHWIRGVLDRSVRHSGLIELGLTAEPQIVDSRWGPIELTAEVGVADVFTQLGGSFLIVGAPGSGKTTTMLKLCRDLADDAARDPGRPIPVVFNLSSWHGGTELRRWLEEEISHKYRIPTQVGSAWLSDGRLQLLLDGLDEVGEGQRSACVDAINEYTGDDAMGAVVCSRLNEYLDLPNRLVLNGAVRVRKLTREQVRTHLKEAGASLEALSTALEQDSSLMVLAQTPFLLGLMIRIYRDAPDAAVEGETTLDLADTRRRVMDAFVKRQFRMAGAEHGHG